MIMMTTIKTCDKRKRERQRQRQTAIRVYSFMVKVNHLCIKSWLELTKRTHKFIYKKKKR